MRNTTWELQGGLKFSLPTPTTIEEYNQLAGVRPADPNSTGIAVLDDAIDNTMYRGPYADVRYTLARSIEREYGGDTPRNKKPEPSGKKDAEGNVIMVYDESEGKYIGRVAAKLGKTPAVFQSVLDEIMTANEALPDTDADKIKLDPSQREGRKGVGGGPTKGDIENAKALVAQGHKKLLISLSKVTQITNEKYELVGKDEPDAEKKNLDVTAGAVRAYRLYLASQTASALKA